MECPCKDCLVLARCRNKNTYNIPLNFGIALNECPYLQEYLGITEASIIQFTSKLNRFKVMKKLNIVSEYIPYEHVTIRCDE